MPATKKPNRTSVSCSLPPEMADRLLKEAESRLLAPSVLLEKAVGLLFNELDATEALAAPAVKSQTP